MSGLEPAHFADFFQQLHGYPPFPWQERLAGLVCAGGWPESIDVPTASGKTACIDIAIFALALKGKEAPRRIFFVVDRRIIVSEAYERAKRICKRLREAGIVAESSVLAEVASALQNLTGDKDADPLQAYELRGGVYRDESWARSALEPAVITSTVDQVGSRLLFRGYGISETSWPIYAGFIANDSLVLLDEAHCSKPFGQTLSAIQRYRGPEWTETPLGRPFHFVEMTATPSRITSEVFRIDDNDRANQIFQRRLFAAKPTVLAPEVNGKKDDFAKLADVLVDQVLTLVAEAKASRAAVIVNRVRTAKLVHERLAAKKLNSLLVIGRMRPIDRDELAKEYEPLKSGQPRKEEVQATFVVSTQCLEVGADLDFDVLVSECASIDALLQRFGRLDRLGDFGRARGSIVIGSWQRDPKKPDAVYGEALANTWAWLNGISQDSQVNMGIEIRDGDALTVAQQLKTTDSDVSLQLRIETRPAPVLLPAHLDALVQTSPRPEPEPAVELFLHGPDDRAADVQVVWRGDLGDDSREWREIVALCPLVAREAMPVQISTFRKWLAGQERPDAEESDLSGPDEDVDDGNAGRPKGLIWADEDRTRVLFTARDVRPGDVVVLPASRKGWDAFGHIPDGAPKDVGDRARFDLKRDVCLRLHPSLIQEWPESEKRERLSAMISDEGWSRKEFCEELKDYRDCFPVLLQDVLDKLPELKRVQLTSYPSGKGYVVEGWFPKEKQGESGQVFLDVHSLDVQETAKSIAARVLDLDLTDTLARAAKFHDYGKADQRFQTWLRMGDELAARFARRPLAKSGVARLGKQIDSGLPEGFRHELLSMLFGAKDPGLGEPTRDLVLHLIASHHGRCRPFAPVISDQGAGCVDFDGIAVCRDERQQNEAHRVESGVADRFWKLTRQYGWWGLAYLEALLRVADWEESEKTTTEVMA